jgi:hypothetical protein
VAAEDTYRRWLHLPDLGALHVALAAVAANLLPSDPTWLLIVGAPSCGKTEIVGGFTGLSYVHATATLTEAALLSGSPKREKADDASGGLLREMGAFGVIATKDFGSMISMNREDQARVLAALREIYDGAWTRRLGVDGGRTLHWSGKCGFLGACTPSIDRGHSVMGALGERFMLYRVSVDDPHEQGRRRLANRGREIEMRDDLGRAVAAVLDGIDEHSSAAELLAGEIEWLVECATFAVTARTAVERNGYDRQVELLPEPEAPARLVGALAQLSAGLSAVGVADEQRWRLLSKTALDSIPSLRRAVLDELAKGDDWITHSRLVERTGIPRTTAGRVLEDLELLGLVEPSRLEGTETRYAPSEFARRARPQPCPEMSEAPCPEMSVAPLKERTRATTTFRDTPTDDEQNLDDTLGF